MEPHEAGAGESQQRMRGVHQPVMVREVLEALAPAPGERFLDLTIGAGGHSFEIASRLGPEGVLVGMDLDAVILEIAGKRLAGPGLARSHLVHGNYLDCRQALAEAGLEKVDGVLADLGASSLQLGAAERGFSFAKDGPLDMRMDAGANATTAEEIVNEAPEGELAEIFWRYGEERFSRRIARRIAEARRAEKITRTGQLAEIIRRAYGRYRSWRINPATKVFQALRIAVNDELGNLKGLLEILPDLVERGGRVAVIAFHSLEDRLVKEDFRSRARSGAYTLITKKPLRPTQAEVEANPRARSARLRAAKRSG